MSVYTITKGLDIPMAGAPDNALEDLTSPGLYGIYQEFPAVKAKLLVREGETVLRGSPLYTDKKTPGLMFCSPLAGAIKAIEYGPRRALYRILIEKSNLDKTHDFHHYPADTLARLDRDKVMENLLQSGLLQLIQQRPFSGIARPDCTPRAIFVNGMNTAPFTANLQVAVRSQETAFQAGLDVLSRLTTGAVHLCIDAREPNPSPAVTEAQRVRVHRFEGPHPAGNTSVHIHHIDPMEPHDVVWTVRGTDVIRIGQLFLDGKYPAHKVLTLAGPGVKDSARKHYRVPVGMPFSALLENRLQAGEQRIINGDALAGTSIKEDEHVRSTAAAITVIPEGRTQFFMGWMAPGINKLSASRAYLSGWNGHKRKWNLTTNLNGSYRSMVLTGLYDQVMPLNIMVDYLVRAVLAHDTDEAMKLGILETDPEDFALCAYVCPSKMDICGIIRQGLREIEKEGI